MSTEPARPPLAETDPPQITWTDAQGEAISARWRSLAGHPPPKRIAVVDDTINADTAYRLACEGTGLLWAGDFQNARLLLQALARRVDGRAARPPGGKRVAAGKRAPAPAAAAAVASPWATTRSTAQSPFNRPAASAAAAPVARLTPTEAFHAQRKAQAQRARILGLLLLPFEADHSVPLRRAPDVRQAGLEAHGPVDSHYVASLRELLGLVGAHEWRKKGVWVDELNAAIHPHHGVFSPVRSEYLALVMQAPLPAVVHGAGAFDIGTGTGVLAALLARRKLRVVATDNAPAALACAQENIARLKLGQKVQVVEADLFPPGRAGLVVCNPPWVPAKPSSPLETAVYDPDSRMLRGYLAGLAAHLSAGGEGWLILSDLAEHLGLRSRAELMGWIQAGGLKVIERLDIRPEHPKAGDRNDPLHRAREAEVTSLWRLAAAG